MTVLLGCSIKAEKEKYIYISKYGEDTFSSYDIILKNSENSLIDTFQIDRYTKEYILKENNIENIVEQLNGNYVFDDSKKYGGGIMMMYCENGKTKEQLIFRTQKEIDDFIIVLEDNIENTVARNFTTKWIKDINKIYGSN